MCVCVHTYRAGHATRLLRGKFPTIHVSSTQFQVLLVESLIPPVTKQVNAHTCMHRHTHTHTHTHTQSIWYNILQQQV